MKIIELDTTGWENGADLYGALLPALGAPRWHGTSVNALIDSIIWGGINALKPPFLIRFTHTSKLPKDVKEEVDLIKFGLGEGCKDYYKEKRQHIDVKVEIVP